MTKGKNEEKGPQAKSDPREKIIDALMGLAAERGWDEISLADVADRAGLTLAQFRDSFPSKGAVLGGFSRRIDKIVLEGGEKLGGESAKDRLFDVLMRRFDAMTPYKPALKNINDWAMHDPLALPALNQLALNSLRFMLEAAGLNSEGPLGTLKLQGLALSWTRVFHVWLADDSEDGARTMAALDKELARGEDLVERVEDARRRLAPFTAPLIGLAERIFVNR
ncbi:TetR/AcrR family transcriptional regulator [Rhodoblastus sp. 17X3]|uniref:TetR/AcrR family transcriptional regulator n=1 Tax=Rhodoblastus sp. 17X3 TaxID=3047026 RepID=UPI0024B704E8|nr:TetR/AcrR family transcriptional regulator [Rhodoblastus sp. 17X3]MDI9846783.1 TetR/AcrR family transcriptional regulator [Rhodoblastus sp. 17X3]